MSDVKQDVPQPLFLDVGKQKRKRIKQLKRGAGPLAAQVQAAVEQARAQSPESGDDQREVIPVVLLFEQKRKRP